MKNTLVWNCCSSCCRTAQALHNTKIEFPGISSRPQFYPIDIPSGKLRISSAFQTGILQPVPMNVPPLKTKWAVICPPRCCEPEPIPHLGWLVMDGVDGWVALWLMPSRAALPKWGRNTWTALKSATAALLLPHRQNVTCGLDAQFVCSRWLL